MATLPIRIRAYDGMDWIRDGTLWWMDGNDGIPYGMAFDWHGYDWMGLDGETMGWNGDWMGYAAVGMSRLRRREPVLALEASKKKTPHPTCKYLPSEEEQP
ncbi:hypothetical protein MJO28_017248 [Puccinia striiformis f. sp. tritici]|nr:hypothetical protein MJO28_017248 [Puccinia striiformis f. sp. tritici]